jgi:hypothetical protein
MFTSKAHLLSELRETLNQQEIREFAKSVSEDPLNRVEVRSSGKVDQILSDLMDVSKAVLENAYSQYLEDKGQFDETFDEDDEEDDDDDSIDLDEEE